MGSETSATRRVCVRYFTIIPELFLAAVLDRSRGRSRSAPLFVNIAATNSAACDTAYLVKAEQRFARAGDTETKGNIEMSAHTTIQ